MLWNDIPDLVELLGDRVVVPVSPSLSRAIDMLALALAPAAGVDSGKIARAAWERELLGSTEAQGISFPRARLPSVARVRGALGVVGPGDQGFESPPGPRIVCLMVAPANEWQAFPRALSLVLAALEPPGVRDAILAANDTRSVLSVLREGAGTAKRLGLLP